jgi:hypothetical protein
LCDGGIANDERLAAFIGKDGQQREFPISWSAERKKKLTERRTDSKSGPRVIRGVEEKRRGRTTYIITE